jgi:hypothetical protein
LWFLWQWGRWLLWLLRLLTLLLLLLLLLLLWLWLLPLLLLRRRRRRVRLLLLWLQLPLLLRLRLQLQQRRLQRHLLGYWLLLLLLVAALDTQRLLRGPAPLGASGLRFHHLLVLLLRGVQLLGHLPHQLVARLWLLAGVRCCSPRGLLVGHCCCRCWARLLR